MAIFSDTMGDAAKSRPCKALLCMACQSRAELMGRDWLQQLCIVNIDARKNAQEAYFNLYHFSTSACKSAMNQNKIK